MPLGKDGRCVVIADGGRSAARPCTGSWCGLADANAWTASSAVLTAYALELGKWAALLGGQTEVQKAALEMLLKRKQLEDARIKLRDLVSAWGALVMARTDLDRDIGELALRQDELCAATRALLDAPRAPGSPSPPAPPARWTEIEAKAKEEAQAWSWQAPALAGSGAVIAVAVVVGGVLLYSANAGKRGRR